LKRRNNRIP